MKQLYTFKVMIDDFNDEFSESFNPNDEEQVKLFEQEFINTIEQYSSWRTVYAKLIKVENNL